MKLEYSVSASKQFKKLDKQIQKRIALYMSEVEKLSDPRSRGKPLTADKAGLWRYRIGDYRIVTEIQDKILLITIIKIGHRSTVYD